MTLDLAQFSQEKAWIRLDQTSIKLDGRFYLESHLRPCFDDSPRLELRKLQASDLVELDDATDWLSVGIRPVPSEEMLAYDNSEASIEQTVEEPREDRTYRKGPDPTYKRVMKSLRAFGNTPLVLGVPKAPSKPTWSKSTSTHQSVPCEVPKAINPGPRGLVNVFKPCAIQVKKVCLKVDNIEISQRYSPQRDVLRSGRRTQKPKICANPSLKPANPKESNLVTTKALNIPPELFGVYDLYKNARKLPETIQESDWTPPMQAVKRARSTAKSSSLYQKSSIKLFFCNHCQTLKKSHVGVLPTLSTGFPGEEHVAPRPDPSLEYFYQNLVQSLNKLSRKLPMG